MIKTIKRIDDGDDHLEDCTFCHRPQHVRNPRKAKIFTALRNTAYIPKINIFGILAKMLFIAYCLMAASVQIM
jgi:hypothetical protein